MHAVTRSQRSPRSQAADDGDDPPRPPFQRAEPPPGAFGDGGAPPPAGGPAGGADGAGGAAGGADRRAAVKVAMRSESADCGSADSSGRLAACGAAGLAARFSRSRGERARTGAAAGITSSSPGRWPRSSP